ncbi:hypothetical protein OSB04_022723 [Centaurea solstitialis]|uniref:Protein LURP-one-related 8 n=1 Tax=Centaurea solstitialis TaxID=347529 RepID=A0AA38SW47_9ASTR|nr:hypothetical protein OSB04_022723 [Centaurea solstitialis]
MAKVHPNAVVSHTTYHQNILTPSPLILTVWKKSLLFNCYGFTVFDSNGNLLFRVDNYSTGTTTQILLMDACGRSLLTIRRKRLSLLDNWLIYDGETRVNPRFTVTKRVNLLNKKSLAHVTATGSKKPTYEIEGSYTRRSCVVYDEKRRRVAEIKRKEAAVGGVAFGGDVFRLCLLRDDMDPAVAMAIVIILDQMFL